MVTIEQVRQLETKIAKAIEYVNQLTGENNLLREENGLLRGKLESSLKRVDELEASVQRFKDDQARIEEGVIAALDRLNQFEDAIGKRSSSVQAVVTSSLSVDKPTDSPGQLTAGDPASLDPATAVSADANPAVPVQTLVVEESDFFQGLISPGADFPPKEEPLQNIGEAGAGELDIF